MNELKWMIWNEWTDMKELSFFEMKRNDLKWNEKNMKWKWNENDENEMKMKWNEMKRKEHENENEMIEGSLEVKLPTIWTDEKQRWKGSERREE